MGCGGSELISRPDRRSLIPLRNSNLNCFVNAVGLSHNLCFKLTRSDQPITQWLPVRGYDTVTEHIYHINLAMRVTTIPQRLKDILIVSQVWLQLARRNPRTAQCWIKEILFFTNNSADFAERREVQSSRPERPGEELWKIASSIPLLGSAITSRPWRFSN